MFMGVVALIICLNLFREARPGISIYSNDAFDQMVLADINLKAVGLSAGVSELASLADEQVLNRADPTETISILLDPSLTKERWWFLRWLPERSVHLQRKESTLTQILEEFTNDFGKTYVKLGRHAIIVPDDAEAIKRATAKLCKRALAEMTMPDLAVEDLPVKAVLEQLEADSGKEDRYGKGVRVKFAPSVTKAQLAKRMTTKLYGRSFESQFGWACDTAWLAYEVVGYEDDRLLVEVRPREDAVGTLPKPFQMGEGHPKELVIHDGDGSKGIFLEIPSESQGELSIWVDDKPIVTALKPGSVVATPTGKKIVLRQDGEGDCFGRYRFYAWIVNVTA